MSWTTERAIEFAATVAMWPVSISREGETITGIATPSRTEKQMTQAAYMPERTATYDMLRTDQETLGITLRGFFEAQSKNWECVAIEDDSTEPTLRVFGVLKK